MNMGLKGQAIHIHTTTPLRGGHKSMMTHSALPIPYVASVEYIGHATAFLQPRLALTPSKAP
jgi:hypothetical protein